MNVRRLVIVMAVLVLVAACQGTEQTQAPPTVFSGKVADWAPPPALTLKAVASGQPLLSHLGTGTLDTTGVFSIELKTPRLFELLPIELCRSEDKSVVARLVSVQTLLVEDADMVLGFVVMTDRWFRKYGRAIYLEHAVTVTPECWPTLEQSFELAEGWNFIIEELTMTPSGQRLTVTLGAFSDDIRGYFTSAGITLRQHD